MSIEITEKMFNQLSKYFEIYEDEWFIVIIEFDNPDFLRFEGAVSFADGNLSFKGISGCKLSLFFNNVTQKPSIELVDEFKEPKINSFINLHIQSRISGKIISNQWNPPDEVKFPGNLEVDFPVLSEYKLEKILNQILANNGKYIKLNLTYFDEDVYKLKSFIDGYEKGIPKTKTITVEGKIISSNSVVECIKTEKNELLSLFYLKSLKVPVLMGMKFNNEIRISELQFEIKG
jgi:hypothetical protein